MGYIGLETGIQHSSSKQSSDKLCVSASCRLAKQSVVFDLGPFEGTTLQSHEDFPAAAVQQLHVTYAISRTTMMVNLLSWIKT